MSVDILTTSGINSLVNSYIQSETVKRVLPLKTRQSKYNSISSSYSKILNYLDSLKNELSSLSTQGNNSIFKLKSATSSNESRVIASTSANTNSGTYNIKVNQLAKSDSLFSIDRASASISNITSPGEYFFNIRTGDGQGGNFNARVKVALDVNDFNSGTISYSSLANKINSAINNDVAEINSDFVSGSISQGGSFKFNFGGTEHTINYSADDYSNVLDNIVSQLNNITGVTAQKVTSGNNYSLRIRSNDNSKFIQLKDDTGSLLSNLNITSEKEFAASQIITSSVFSPASGRTQISFSTKNTGYDYRIVSISDITSNGVLSEFGLDLGNSRPSFVQVDNGDDTPGFIYQTSDLNSKITFNGVQIQRNNNEIKDLVDGITFKLKSISPNNEADTIISISSNTNEIKSKVQNFINKFNELYVYLKENSNTSKDKRGLLVGDSNTSSLLNLLSSQAINVLQGFSSTSINSLTKLGITFNVESGLRLSSDSQLTNAIENQINEVESFFNSNQGFAKLFLDAVQPYTGPNGYIKKAQNQISSSMTNLSDSIRSSELRISKSADALRKQYQKLQSQLASLLSNQGYFLSNFNNMNNQQNS